MSIVVDCRHSYEYRGINSQCRLRICEGRDDITRYRVLLTWDDRSFGASPTNIFETMALALIREYPYLNFESVWITHYQRSEGSREVEYVSNVDIMPDEIGGIEEIQFQPIDRNEMNKLLGFVLPPTS